MFIPAVKILNWLYVMNLSVNNLFVIENIVFICVVVYFVISNVTHSRVVKKRNSKLLRQIDLIMNCREFYTMEIKMNCASCKEYSYCFAPNMIKNWMVYKLDDIIRYFDRSLKIKAEIETKIATTISILSLFTFVLTVFLTARTTDYIVFLQLSLIVLTILYEVYISVFSMSKTLKDINIIYYPSISELKMESYNRKIVLKCYLLNSITNLIRNNIQDYLYSSLGRVVSFSSLLTVLYIIKHLVVGM